MCVGSQWKHHMSASRHITSVLITSMAVSTECYRCYHHGRHHGNWSCKELETRRMVSWMVLCSAGGWVARWWKIQSIPDGLQDGYCLVISRTVPSSQIYEKSTIIDCLFKCFVTWTQAIFQHLNLKLKLKSWNQFFMRPRNFWINLTGQISIESNGNRPNL